jgi:hypothetical protein
MELNKKPPEADDVGIAKVSWVNPTSRKSMGIIGGIGMSP